MLEMIVRRVGRSFLYVSKDGLGILNRKVSQQAATVLPELEICCLYKVLDQRTGGLAPQRGGAHDGQADGPSNSRNELLPCFVIRRAGAEADHVLQRQGRVTRRPRCHRHFVVPGLKSQTPSERNHTIAKVRRSEEPRLNSSHPSISYA